MLLAAGLVPAAAADFEKDVLPVFRAKCHSCHGDGKSKGAVNLDPEHMHRIIGEAGSGRAIAAGSADESRLFEVVANRDDDAFMPPPGKGEPLTRAELRELKAWIDGGAKLGTDSGGPDGEKPSESRPGGGRLGGAANARQPVTGDWTNREGRTITATLTGIEGDKAVLRLPNGRVHRYPIDQFDEPSRAKVLEFAAPIADKPKQ